jgi:hypothetical protein
MGLEHTKNQLDQHGNEEHHGHHAQIIIDAEPDSSMEASEDSQHDRDQAQTDQDRNDLNHLPTLLAWRHCTVQHATEYKGVWVAKQKKVGYM